MFGLLLMAGALVGIVGSYIDDYVINKDKDY